MSNKINQPVEVVFNKIPKEIIWNNRNYFITKLGLHHTYYSGQKLIHVFSVASNHLFFRLLLDSHNLNWVLDEIYDESK